jgi:hypothetical protein
MHNLLIILKNGSPCQEARQENHKGGQGKKFVTIQPGSGFAATLPAKTRPSGFLRGFLFDCALTRTILEQALVTKTFS